MTTKIVQPSRVWSAFAICALLLACMAVVAIVGMRYVLRTTEQTLVHDVHESEEGLQALTTTLALRRWEKDYFENMGLHREPFFTGHWQQSRAELAGRIDALDQAAASSEDHAEFQRMRDHLAAYGAGFEKVTAAIASGRLATPEAANLAMAPYKDDVHQLEVACQGVGTASKERTRLGIERLRGETAATMRTLNIVAFVAVVVAGAIAFLLRRQIKASSNEMSVSGS